MTMTKVLTSVACVAAMALSAAPAQAQHRGGGGNNGGGSRGGAVSRGGGGGGGSRGVSGPRVQSRSAPVYRGGGNVYRGGANVYRGGGNVYRSSGNIYRGGAGVYRGGGGSRVVTRFGGTRSVIVGRPGFYRPYYSRPYYSFRPRLSLGFGLWAGYPVAYPYYGYPYSYAYPYDPYAYDYATPSYGYPAPTYPATRSVYPSAPYPSDYPDAGSYGPPDYSARQAPPVGAERGQSASGGVSFEITPESAAVFVDGTYIGTVGAYGPTMQPLGLTPGRHHIEIRASGYRTMTFDADVRSGQVIPYQGTLQRD